MPALLRILSKDEHSGNLESRLVYLNSISDVSLSITPAEDYADEAAPESESETEGEKFNIDGSESADYLELSLMLRRTDGTEENFNLLERTYNFDIRDEDGEIMCMTDDPFEIEAGLLIAAMDTSHKRTKAAEKLAKEQKEKREAKKQPEPEIETKENKS